MLVHGQLGKFLLNRIQDFFKCDYLCICNQLLAKEISKWVHHQFLEVIFNQ